MTRGMAYAANLFSAASFDPDKGKKVVHMCIY